MKRFLPPSTGLGHEITCTVHVLKVPGKCDDARIAMLPAWTVLSLTRKSRLVTKVESSRELGLATKEKKKKKKKPGAGNGGQAKNPFALLMDA